MAPLQTARIRPDDSNRLSPRNWKFHPDCSRPTKEPVPGLIAIERLMGMWLVMVAVQVLLNGVCAFMRQQ